MSSKIRLLSLVSRVCFVGAMAICAFAQTDDSLCWKHSFGRGVGGIGKQCPAGSENQAGLCYPTCQAGYNGVGPVCWQSCPSGFTDIGVGCQKPGDITSAGYPWKIGDTPFDYSAARDRCQAAHPDVGCSKSGLIYYPNCPANYHNVGAPICTPNCPSGMTDTGLDCTKNTYGRGAGTIPSCGSGQDEDAGLCYPSCGAGYDGVGPVCWGECPADHPYQCGAACATSQGACVTAVGNMVLDTAGVAINIASMVAGGPGVGDALRAAMEAGDSGMARAVLQHVPESGESLLWNASKSYSADFSKQFVKTMLKNQYDDANLFWRVIKMGNTGMLYTLNKAATEFGVEKETSAFDLSTLTALDPTGIASMVTAFTKYKSCDSDQFAVDRPELNFGTINGSATETVTLIAQKPTTVTRIVSPAFSNITINPTAECVGKQLLPAQTCTVTITITGQANLDSEVRIYTDEYTTVPFPVHLLANSGAAVAAAIVPNAGEKLNISDIQGVWAYTYDQSKKVIVDSTGYATAWTGAAVSATPAGDAGRAFSFGGSLVTLNDAGDRLTGSPWAGTITESDSGQVVDVYWASTDDGAEITVNPLNGGQNQQFTFDPQPDGTYRIVAWHSGKVLDVYGASTDPGAQVDQFTWNGGANQRWRIESVGDGSSYRIVNLNSGLVLQGNGAGQSLTQATWNSGANQRFKVGTMGDYIRRPWDSGCNAGEVNFAGLCYDVPPGWAMTTPGIMGKVCPADWRDDGTVCWPPWTGKAVDNVADPNGSDTMRHPLVVTSCTNYDQANGQSCPANWSHSAVCSCQPNTMSKSIKSIIGHS